MRAGAVMLIGLAACGPQPAPDGNEDAVVVVVEPTRDEGPGDEGDEPDQVDEHLPVGRPDTPCHARVALALQTALGAQRDSELDKGMRAAPPFKCANVADGGTVTARLNISPGGCYAVLAHALPPITGVELQMRFGAEATMPPIFTNLVLAKGTGEGGKSTLGAGPNCFKAVLPIPMPVDVIATARGGDGPIALQAYTR